MDEGKNAANLKSTFVVIDPRLRAHEVPVTDTIYRELDERFDRFAGHSLVAVHSFDADWPTWEMHPHGDEVVCLLSGRAEMRLAESGGERSALLEAPGAFLIVPRGTWHTARIREATTMLFVTPGEGTENRESPGAGR